MASPSQERSAPSLSVKATRGAAWMVAAGLAARALTLGGTLLIVRLVSPGEYGEALTTVIVVATISQFLSLGVGRFVVVKAGGRRDLAFAATVFQLLLGVGAAGTVLIFRDPLGSLWNVPGMGRYIPLMALSMLLDRVWYVPEQTLIRQMRFRAVALNRLVGETCYTAVSLATAFFGWGGMAIVAGNVARSAVRVVVTVPAVDRRDWFEPCRISRDSVLAILRFGAPLAIGALATFAASRWDNLLVAMFFGPAVMAAYNVAYNLASAAPGLVADQVVDILIPSFARAEARKRPEAFLRGVSLLALVVVPLCLGLAVVSPTVVSAMFQQRWAAVAPMLGLLSLVSALGPLLWLSFAYLQACGRTKAAMVLQLIIAALILGAVGTIGRAGPLWACGAVGLGVLASILVAAFIIRAVDGTSVVRLLSTQLPPLLASVPMVGAVLGARWLLTQAAIDLRAFNLVVEVLAGAIGYVAGAFVVARPQVRELIGLMRAAFLRRRGPGSSPVVTPS